MASPTTSPPPTDPPPKPFRFKRKRPTSPSLPDTAPNKRHRSHSSSDSPHHRHHHRHRHHHHRSRRHLSSPPPSPHLDPDTAFRESLFDALADDEGAAFWESVYGQPIHTYSPYKPTPTSSTPNPEQDSLQRMTDEEYTAYVRAKMWEKSHGYVVEERRRREEERVGRRKREGEAREWERGVEEALRRGEERRRKGRWKGLWEGYLRGWERFVGGGGEEESGKAMKERIPWPVEGGRLEDIGKEDVETFFKHAPGQLGDVLRRERVRWHPDKMLQRAGGLGVDEGAMRGVTAVFQVVDELWSESKTDGLRKP